MKKLLTLLLCFLFILPIPAAASVDTATASVAFSVSNSGSAVTNDPYFAKLSSQNLYNAGLISASGLNQQVVDGSATNVPFMPSTLDISPQYLLADDGGVFTNETSSNGTANALTLLPTTPAVSDAYYFGMSMAGRIVKVNVSTVGAGTWTITWEYYNGSSWVALSNVTDGTNGFRVAGIQAVSFDLPASMPASTVNALSSYWVRARVSAFTSVTTAPRGQQVWTNTGYYAGFLSSLASGANTTNTLYTGLTGAELRTFHHYFPGTGGVTTTDNAAMEPGAGTWEIDYKGFVDTAVSGNLVSKSQELTLASNGSGTITGTVYSAATTTNYNGSANDAGLRQTNAVYATARDAATGNLGTSTQENIGQTVGGDYTIYRLAMLFDTSAIPDGAIITAASMQFVCDADLSTTDFNITIQNGQPTYPGNPPVAADYNRLNYSGDGGSLTTSGIVCDSSTYQIITMNSDGRSWISDTGFTKLMLRSSRDINNNTPGGDEYVRVLMQESASADPRLSITYLTPTSVSKTGVTAASHTILFGTDSSNLYISIDGGAQTTTPRATVLDNANNWVWSPSTVTPYLEYVKMTVAGTQQMWYQLNVPPATTFPDRSGQSHPGTPTYPETFPATLSVDTGPVVSISATVSTGTDEPLPSILPTNNQNLSQSGGNVGNFILDPIFTDVANLSDLPKMLFYYVLTFGATIAVTILILYKTQGNLILSAGACVGTIALCYRIGALDVLWPVFIIALVWFVVIVLNGRHPGGASI